MREGAMRRGGRRGRVEWGCVVAAVVVLEAGFVWAYLEEERQPTYLRAAVGEAVAFNCYIEFPHDVAIPYILNWNKEGERIFSSYEATVSAKGPFRGRIKTLSSDPRFGKASINITNIRESDGGWYECEIVYPNRSPSRHQNGTWFHLKVDGGNVIAIPPINQTTVEGEWARFPCSTKEKSSSVVWRKDGVRLSNRNHNFPERYAVDREGTLSISPTGMDDSGEFTCEATNSKGEKQSASAFLNVQYKAKVIHTPKEIYLPYGRSAVIDCHFRSNPPLMKLRWEKDGFLFDPYNVQGVVYRSNGSLYFEEVKEEHGGLYTCTPFNDLGTEGPSPKMNVVVQKPPVFTLTPHMLYVRRKGDSLQIPCDATEDHGVHKPRIAWLKNGAPLPEHHFGPSGGNLTLTALREEDRGVYQCVASNAVTSISTETELMIENTAPRAPYELQADSTETTITVRWKSGLTRPKLDFSVWYSVAEAAVWTSSPAVGAGVREVRLDDLLPGTEYELMVLSKDAYGDGMFSKSIRIHTKGNAQAAPQRHPPAQPPGGPKASVGPPTNVNLRLSPDGWTLTWDPPVQGAADLEYYAVQWKEDGDALSAFTTENHYSVKDSLKREQYSFQVSAVAKDQSQSEGCAVAVQVPADRRAKAVTLGLSLGLALLVITVFLTWFLHKHFTQKHA